MTEGRQLWLIPGRWLVRWTFDASPPYRAGPMNGSGGQLSDVGCTGNNTKKATIKHPTISLLVLTAY